MAGTAVRAVGGAAALSARPGSALRGLNSAPVAHLRPAVGAKRGWAASPPSSSRPGPFPARAEAQKELYPAPGWPWQYPAAKPGTTLADGWFLWVTQAAHYAIFISQLALAHRIFQVVQLPAVAEATALPFWAIMCPVFQALAGFGTVLMHEYEGWQIAPFREPPVDNSSANNQQLREAAFRVLFQWQGIASAFAALGVFGLERWLGHTLTAPIPLAVYLAGLAVLYFGPPSPPCSLTPASPLLRGRAGRGPPVIIFLGFRVAPSGAGLPSLC
ncbi:hypothetical protein ABPG75_009429 [Micractinium tetrahymenae]